MGGLAFESLEWLRDSNSGIVRGTDCYMQSVPKKKKSLDRLLVARDLNKGWRRESVLRTSLTTLVYGYRKFGGLEV